jgi:hypothetical protein
MPLVNLARDVICDKLLGLSVYNPYNATYAHVGVGDSSTAHAASQTDLQAATNKLRKIVDSTPSRTANTMRFIATFGTGDANFAWNEWAVFNASSGTTAPAAMLSRKVESLGTKSGGTWQLTVDVTITI